MTTGWDEASNAIELAILDLVGPKGYVHGWKFVGVPGDDRGSALRKRGFSETDIHAIRGHEAQGSEKSRKELDAPVGTHAHAEELRGLAVESDRRQAENYQGTRTSGMMKEGASREDLLRAGGYGAENVPASATSGTLRRAADMIDRGQPSLARSHAGALRDAAAAEKSAGMRPDFARRLSQSADKLSALPAGQGLAKTAPDNPESLRRTAAARAYAARTARNRRANAGL